MPNGGLACTAPNALGGAAPSGRMSWRKLHEAMAAERKVIERDREMARNQYRKLDVVYPGGVILPNTTDRMEELRRIEREMMTADRDAVADYW